MHYTLVIELSSSLARPHSLDPEKPSLDARARDTGKLGGRKVLRSGTVLPRT
jgi:hypothetical protein